MSEACPVKPVDAPLEVGLVRGAGHGGREQVVERGEGFLNVALRNQRRSAQRVEARLARAQLMDPTTLEAIAPQAAEHLDERIDADWPFIWDVEHGLYFRPESGGLLLRPNALMVDLSLESGEALVGARQYRFTADLERADLVIHAQDLRGVGGDHGEDVVEVDAEVKLRIRTIAPGGGYCLSSSNSIHSSVQPDNFLAMVETLREYGAYPLNA